MNIKQVSNAVLWGMCAVLISAVPRALAFDSLTQASEYANTHEEFPESDNSDLLAPDYTKYHKKFVPGFWGRFLNWSGIKKQIWSAPFFKSTLLDIVVTREHHKLDGKFVQKITPPAGSKILIWGDSHGAFHSLVRSLLFLKAEGVIDDTFKVISKDHYFVFNGNAINRSAYTLETLTLLMQLMRINPEKVFYIKGDHENNNKWLNYGLARELRTRCRYVDPERVPLE
jgi:hypothetical protein